MGPSLQDRAGPVRSVEETKTVSLSGSPVFKLISKPRINRAAMLGLDHFVGHEKTHSMV
jgi:hypothetical protein